MSPAKASRVTDINFNEEGVMINRRMILASAAALAFTATAASAQIQDRTSKPMPLAERDQKLREDVQRGLDFQHPAK